MSTEYYDLKKLAAFYSIDPNNPEILEAEKKGTIPKRKKYKQGAVTQLGWRKEDLPLLGEKWGFFPKFSGPTAMAVFTTKGGVLKTTLTLNLARVAALHNLKTCVIGLDMQGDITTSLGHNAELQESENLQELITKLNQTKGLSDVFNGTARIDEIIHHTDIPTLHYIPETPELAAFNESLSNINRREYWMREKIVNPLKEFYDLIIMDCSPNWNRLITNALVACDVLISPLEAKINNFRNFKVFRHFLNEFKQDMNINFETIFIPTRFVLNKKLSMDIARWYQENIKGCTHWGLRESVYCEEATALRLSLLELTPQKPVSNEVRKLLREINDRTRESQKKKLNNELNKNYPGTKQSPVIQP